ncbi:hypothetical protein B0H14DRAFT_2706019 [Mycena olivaceomarginata]|nr:hypothetical protein B0H14DRAFT_2706019 [Mycena olivaceomarginata]
MEMTRFIRQRGGAPTVRRELRSRTIIPESTLLVEATSEAIGDDHSSKRRRFDAVTPTDASDSHIDSHSPPTTLLVDCHSTSPSERTASPAPRTVATDACMLRIREKHRPPELEARLQSQVCLGGADPEFKSSSASPSASVAISARASGPTVVPHQICSNCRSYERQGRAGVASHTGARSHSPGRRLDTPRAR